MSRRRAVEQPEPDNRTIEQRLEEMRMFLAEELRSDKPSQTYVSDLLLSIQRAEGSLKRLKLNNGKVVA